MPGRRLIPDRARVNRARVRRVDRIAPHVVRVVLGGKEIRALDLGTDTDHYVRLVFPHPEATYPDPFDLRTAREVLPRARWPRTRTYTVRSWDPEAGELAIDFVCHGEDGLAAPWAARARPGEEVLFLGPGGGYAPDPTADWHLLVGDESAFPAISVALERLPSSATARVLVEVDSAADEQQLATTADTEVVWVHRDGGGAADGLVNALRAMTFPRGTVDAFVHGEANAVKELRRLLRIDRGLAREQLSISGYWRRGNDEDGWQAAKAGWNRRLDEEEAAARPRAVTRLLGTAPAGTR